MQKKRKMEEIIQISLPIYFVLFFGYVFIFKSKIVENNIGKNPMVLPKDDTAYGLIGKYFKLINYITILYSIIFGFYPKVNQYLFPFEDIDNYTIKIVGLVILVVAFVWTTIAQANMKNSWRMGIDKETQTQLITTGLFSYSRNPVFVGLLLGFLGLFILTPNLLTLLLFLFEFLLIQIQIRLEEEHLNKSHGKSYVEYKKKTRRLI